MRKVLFPLSLEETVLEGALLQEEPTSGPIHEIGTGNSAVCHVTDAVESMIKQLAEGR